VLAIAGNASNLEYEIDQGSRGSRQEPIGALLARACGGESGMVVNNNAAAILLALRALARGREVVVSRGELVEIGGGFRIPDIIVESGCRLVEVGTTNRTRRSDYERAVTDRTAAILKVHASNYRMVGFTETTPIEELTDLGPPVVFDLGSGLLDETTPWLPHRPTWLGDEPGARQAIDAGATLVTFSGDKLFGGPQAGIAVGDTGVIEMMARHPLARAVRVDKMTLAALQSVVCAYLGGDAAALPFWSMATAPVEALEARASAISAAVVGATVVDLESLPGGGSLPGTTIPSVGIKIQSPDTDGLLTRLRSLGVVARARRGDLVLDLRTVRQEDDEKLAQVIVTALSMRTAR
jgi:L-seryl-tRNA(Ser) seleniumtransferase